MTTAVKTSSVDDRSTHFRTQMVNGRPQIYFEEIEEVPVKPQPKAKRNSRVINPTRIPEQPKSKATSQKPVVQNISNKPGKKGNKVVVNGDDASVGVFMTMEEIAELVKAVKEASKGHSNASIENREEPPPPPPPPPPFQPLPEPQPQQFNDMPSTMALDLPLSMPVVLGPTSPREEALGMMADKKRRKWMREKAEMDRMRLEVEYDQLKHQLTPANQKAASSPERPTYLSDFSSTNKPSGQQNDFNKTGLIERKQQQWRQENAEKAPVWNPFGRPGAGAPNLNEVDQRISQPSSSLVMPYRPPDPSSVSSNIAIHDQLHVPAAMRTNLLLGDVRFEDDVKGAKEMERRQWLDDLQKQIEDNKRKKFTQQETERRQDFLHENSSLPMQEMSHRPPQQKAPSPTSSSNVIATKESSKSYRHDSVVQQTYDKIVEATELAKYEKKKQLIEKLKRNGHRTELLARTLPDVKTTNPDSTHRTIEKSYDTSPKRPTVTKVEPLPLNTVNEHQQSYRTNDARRDEAVNTIDSTFRSDNSVQTDIRMAPQNQMFPFTREESDLPPQVPNHLLREGKQNKKNVRIRSHEDKHRSSMPNTNSHGNGNTSQMSLQRHQHGPHDLLHRPLWNYQNPGSREFVSNSKRDPNFDKRQPQKPTEVPKKSVYNRWNSDSEIQHQHNEKKSNSNTQPRSIVSKQNNHPHSQANLPKDKVFASERTTTDDESNFRNIASLDKYERFIPYTRTDEVLDPARAFSPIPQSRETSANRQRSRTITFDDQQRRQNANVQPPPYHVPPSQQQHILQQLTAIKENLVRRQQEVATSMNAIPV